MKLQLELLAPWYTQNTSESRTLEFFDAMPKYPFPVTTTIEKPERLEISFTLRGKKYTAFITTAQITDARTAEQRLVFPGAREELVERALRFIAVQQIARTRLTPDHRNWTPRRHSGLYVVYAAPPPRRPWARL